MPHPTLDRRLFLLAASGAGAAGLVPTWRTGTDDPDDLAAFARLCGLEFTATERAQAARRLQRLRDDYQRLRASELPFELPPAAHFDPRPMAAQRPETTASERVEVPIADDVAMPDSDDDLAFLSALELQSLLRRGLVSSRQLVELSLDRLERYDPQLFCVVNLLRDEALARADVMDTELEAGRPRSPLHGIPFGAKDLFAWPGAPTTFGAAPFRDHVWNVRATALQRLHDAGAVLVAKLSLGALAMGDVWFGGRTRNPYAPEQGSSGSSAGSAAAVAAGLVPFALGTETLGSILSPCRRCGVGGLRPSFGSISRYGAMPLSWTMDKVGPIARSARDQAVVFDVLRGADGRDPSARDTRFDWRMGRDPRGLRLGVLALSGFPRTTGERRFLTWAERVTGGAPRVITLPDAPLRSLLLLLHAEAAAAFDDFTRQGLDDQLTGQDDGDWPNSFRSARTIPAVEYLRASRLRHRLVQQMHEALAPVDVLVTPTHGGPTLTATNLTGHPTLVLPVDRVAEHGGRPGLLALTGPLDGEGALLTLAEAFQRDTDWHRARPALRPR